ncbi:MAG: LysM peptidoglycan-binding domain-containing protein [Candidatus Acidiferrales bacterium]
MKQKSTIWVLLAAGTLVLAGCDDSAKKQTKAQAPTTAPAPAPEYVREALPVSGRAASFPDLAPRPRPAVDLLVEQVQASFDAGQKKYKAGDFDNARVDFDRAVDQILTSGLQADSDPRLSQLVDQIGETLHSYEVNAEQSADEENSGTPAPIDELTDLTLPAGDQRLVARAEQELIKVPHDLPLTVNDSVLQYLSFFSTTRGRAIVERGLDRAGRYNDMIRRVLKEEGVPQDLIYLAQAESAFLPQAVSRAGARGIWQFMPFRGQEYDLDRTYWVDERSDPEKATRAAARHMRDLYDMFGDWYLVMAAYNAGPMGVVKAIERTGYADFWELQKRHALPKQTQNYVPIIIALALVGKQPALYGVEVQAEKPVQADMVKPGHPISLSLVADATGADLDDLRMLNPQLLRNATPNDPQFELKLPPGMTEKFAENIRRVPVEKWTSWRLHAVGSGETLGEVARHYRVTVSAIENANHLEAHAVLPSGFLLNVPTPPPAVKLVSYRVKRGDTLEGIAERYDVTVAQLKHWNNIHGTSVPRGSRLRIYAGGDPVNNPRAKSKVAENGAPAVRSVSTGAADKEEALKYHVKPGETLYSIARAYKTTISALRHSNPFLADRPLEAGDVITIQR